MRSAIFWIASIVAGPSMMSFLPSGLVKPPPLPTANVSHGIHHCWTQAPKVRMLSLSNPASFGVLPLASFVSFLATLDELVPGPCLARIRRRVRQLGIVEDLLAVPDHLDLVGNADADDLAVRGDELDRVQLCGPFLVEVRQVDELSAHSPGEHVGLVERAHVRQRAAGRERGDLVVELGVRPEAQTFDLDVGVLVHEHLEQAFVEISSFWSPQYAYWSVTGAAPHR